MLRSGREQPPLFYLRVKKAEILLHSVLKKDLRSIRTIICETHVKKENMPVHGDIVYVMHLKFTM